MKKVYALLLAALVAGITYGQTVVEFDDLQTPASPGFILMDETPSAIERPTSPQGFGLSALNLFKGGAIEVAPFWLKAHPNLTAKQMAENKTPLLYNLSISAATANLDSGKYITGGIRTRLVQVYSKTQLNKRDSLQKVLINLLSKDPDSLDMNAISAAGDSYDDFVKKPVFTLDIAGAIALNANEAENNRTVKASRWATWLAFNWRPKGDDFYVTAVGRYVYNVKFEEYANRNHLFDYGARLNYDIGKFTLSAEALQRLNFTESDFSNYRLAIVASYQVIDNIYFTGTFGKNFEDTNNLITLVGINFGISKNKLNAF
jgi:hypothetical protein